MAGTSTGGGRRSPFAPYLLIAPGVLWLGFFFLVPLVTLARTSLAGSEAAWWTGYLHAIQTYGEHFGRSFGYALAATLIAVLVGYPLAYVMAFRAGRLRNFLLGLVILPFFTTFLVRTLAWKTILGDDGMVVETLKWLHLLPPDGRLLNTMAAVVGGLTYNFLPFMILPIYVSIEKIDPRLLEAARDLYSGGFRTFRKVLLPLSLPGVLAGSLLTFIPAAGDFVNAQYLGGTNQSMVGTVIQSQFLVTKDYPLAAALSFVLMLIILVAVLIYTKVLGTEDLVT